LLFACALTLSALALGLTSLVAPLDAAISRAIGLLFALTASNLNFFDSGWISHLANYVALTMAAFGAECIVFKLVGVPRAVALLQLLVASILCLGFLLFFHLSITAISFLLVVVLGYVSGIFFRFYEQKEKEREAIFYELKLANRQLQEARLFMAKQDEIDRRLLAADLHDQVLNDLKLVSEKAKTMKAYPREDTAKEVEKLLQQSMKAVREVMENLSPSLLEHLGFASALEDCVRSAAARGGFKAKFKCQCDEERLDNMSSVEKILLYRLIQECCTNVCKHAQASELKVSIDSERTDGSHSAFCLRVVDDGKGMAVAAIDPQSRGLQYMRQRAQLIGASIVWLVGPENKGTAVEIRWSLATDKKAKVGT
jgi:signal transduction histidine kinase